VDFSGLIDSLGESTVNGLAKGSIYALVALGYTLVYGVLRLINFAHSEVFMVGTWTILGVYTWLGVTAGSSAGFIAVALLLGLVGAVLASAGTALVVERVAYRPLRRKNAPPLIFLITAIGCSLALVELFGFVLRQFFGPPFGRALISLPELVPHETWISIGDTDISNIRIIVIVSAILMMIALDMFVNKSRMGRGIRAVAQDPDTASLMGVNQDRVIMLVFIVGGALAGVAATLYELNFGFTQANIGFLVGLKAFTAAVLGGIGNLRGALLGGLVLGVVEVYSATLFSSNWQDVTAFVVLVLVLMFRPTGLLGESLGKARA
jgi:branched-chain amino acid transport system permease protein